jgi:hypothetical protein
MTAVLETTSLPICRPRWATRRSPERSTLGGRAAEVAAMLGTPLMPWQRVVADTALEVDRETGCLAFREVILTVPRQSGKTTLLLAVMVHRALGFGERQRVLYTAQTRNDARKKWEDEHVAVLEQSPLRAMFRVRRSNGAEAIRWNNGSMHGVTSSTEKAGHGETLDLGVIDEAFAHEDDRLEQALKPTMVTRPQPQLWIVSTAGTLKSTYLREKVEAGRLAADAGISAGVAYFEWSAAPDVDPADEQARYSYMPALGRTVRPDGIAADFQTMKLDEYRRAYMNQWQLETPDEWLVIRQGEWDALVGAASERTGPVAFAADMTPDRSWGSIGVAWRDHDGLLHVEIPDGDHRPGTAWMADRLIELYQTWPTCAVVVAAEGPASSLLAPLQAQIPKDRLLRPTAQQRAAATGQFYEAVTDSRSLRHLGQPELANALAGARRQELGDQWWWARRGLLADVSPLVAVTYAAWGHSMRAHDYQSFGEPSAYLL